jgi:hypothetical protein
MSEIKPEIVVASYRENLWWVPKLKDMGYNVTVYNTAPDSEPFSFELDSNSEVSNLQRVQHTKLPNTDREAGQFLYHLVNRRDTLSKYTVFLQGDLGWMVCNYDKHTMGAAENKFTELVEWLDEASDCGADYLTFGFARPEYRHTQEHDQNIFKDFMQPNGAEFCPLLIPITSNGAQFRVSREKILALPEEYLKNLLAISNKDPLAFRFEWAWGLVLDGSKMAFAKPKELITQTNKTRNTKNENAIPETTGVC